MPLSDAELDEKFTELVTPVIGPVASSQLLENLWQLDTIDVNVCLAVSMAPR